MNGSFTVEDTRITPEKAAIVSKLSAMKANDWSELRSMSNQELDELWNEVDAAHVILDYGHPHNKMRDEAYREIKHERAARRISDIERRNALRTRENSIMAALNSLEQARKLLDTAYSIDPAPLVLEQPPAVDVAEAGDNELLVVLGACQRIAGYQPLVYPWQLEVLSAINTTAAKAIVKELKAKAKADEERRARAQEIAAEIVAERDKREAAKPKPEDMSAEALLGRIKELEAKVNVEG